MKKKLIYSILFSLLSLQVMAQLKISGKVTGSSDNLPLPSVSVRVKGTTAGTQTDASGNYILNLTNANATLVFSYTGFATQEVNVGGRTIINVQLKETQSALNEVVVIGYGTARKSDLTGSVATVKAEQLLDKPVPNLSQALQGKVAGVDVSVNSNAPGAAAKVRIRGIGSVNSNVDPIYVVDGVVGVDPNSINPNDVASIEVLKDASSTAIYGVRGANGVIMVTTKRGRKGPATVSYEGNGNISQLYRSVPTLNSKEFIQIYNQSFANGAKFDPNGVVQQPAAALNHINFPRLFDANDNPLYDTNWEKETYKPSFSQSHQLNIQGGSENSVYSLSLGYLNQEGLTPTSNFKRYTVKMTMDNDVKKWLKVGGSLNGIFSRQRLVSDGNGGLNVPRAVSEEVPIVPVKYPDGTWAGNYDIAGLEGAPNPVQTSNERYTLNNTLQVLGNFYAQFKISKELDFKTDFGYNLSAQKNNFYSGLGLQHMSADQGGVANITTATTIFWQTENYLTWNHKINDHQRLTALAGISFNRSTYERAFVESQNFIDDFFQFNNLGAGSVRSSSTSDEVPNTPGALYPGSLNSYYGRINYNIDEKYLFTATGRYDGSSRPAENHKFSFFPSVGAAWRVSQEDFLKNSQTVSNLKVRASFGYTGNQEIGNYKSLAQYSTGQTAQNGQTAISLLPNYIGNPDLKWERTRQIDGGIELGLFGGRVNLDADYYQRTTTDLLLQAPIPYTAGFTTANVYKNVGSVRNSGVELNLNTVNVKTSNFEWSTSYIFAANKNKVLKLNDGGADIFPGPNFLGQNYVIRVGAPIGSFYGMTRVGTYGDNAADVAEAAKHGLKAGDRKYIYNPDGSNYYSIIGRSNPKWTGNFNSTMKYKNWDFSFDIRFVQGVNTAANFKHSSEDRQTISNSLKTVLNGWTPSNQNTMISQVRNYKYAQDSHFDTWWVEDGSFVRGQNFILGYSLPASALQSMHVSRFRIYASVQNLFVITNYTGYDPEVDTFNNSYGSNPAFSQNIDFFANPRPRVWNLGVQVGF
ncbi:SusC/RagA family TonB-linked outer membrane protein [Mucilaginibacter aquaedulcis]|jgi:TonB-linked SusC/RagA family outer membrane protein|uniref:SusC/RagA family TonB-linked outer membrane protein n=1 Tax=Mucilaginibacter aquaedulcis TaxID=1187081 RepID=UPI0025B49B12|nr:TonB-dependent receptor [Mucilaginibacter aquaedulcis]MDN3549957.1 TonB-dependent receptor [Mucilaginibacter aquaedulcis]